MGDFVEALEASRLSQDISTAVYQQLVALDDFVTFKKLMVRPRVVMRITFAVRLSNATKSSIGYCFFVGMYLCRQTYVPKHLGMFDSNTPIYV